MNTPHHTVIQVTRLSLTRPWPIHASWRFPHRFQTYIKYKVKYINNKKLLTSSINLQTIFSPFACCQTLHSTNDTKNSNFSDSLQLNTTYFSMCWFIPVLENGALSLFAGLVSLGFLSVLADSIADFSSAVFMAAALSVISSFIAGSTQQNDCYHIRISEQMRVISLLCL